MKSWLGHIQLNVQPANLPFYKELMAFLGWPTLWEAEGMLGVGGETSLWFLTEVNSTPNDYDGPGMNHVGISVAMQGDVDSAAAWLKERGVAWLFETPRHRPEFSEGDKTYYQVMFESPDRILWEIVYTGPKS